LVNLEGFVHIQVVACDEGSAGAWAVEGLLRDRSPARLLVGDKAECQALLDEVSQAVWAIEVGAVGRVEAGTGAPCAPGTSRARPDQEPKLKA